MYKQPVFQLTARDTVDAIVKRVREKASKRVNERQTGPYTQTNALQPAPQSNVREQYTNQFPLTPTSSPNVNERFTPQQSTTPYQQAPPHNPDMQSSPGFMDPNQQFTGNGQGAPQDPRYSQRYTARSPIQSYRQPEYNPGMQWDPNYRDGQPSQQAPSTPTAPITPNTGSGNVDNKWKQNATIPLQKPEITRPQQLTPTSPTRGITPIPRPTDPRKGAMQNFLTKGRTQI